MNLKSEEPWIFIILFFILVLLFFMNEETLLYNILWHYFSLHKMGQRHSGFINMENNIRWLLAINYLNFELKLLLFITTIILIIILSNKNNHIITTRGANVIVVVFDVSDIKTLGNAENWLAAAHKESSVGNAIVFLVSIFLIWFKRLIFENILNSHWFSKYQM